LNEVVIGGGSTLNAGFLEEHLIDEIYLDVEPLIFGKGIELFKDTDTETKLELLETASVSRNVIRLHYRVV
jgi:dihydrofolate reductase